MTDLEAALFSLREQSIKRGLGGRLEDFDIARCEDGSISIWAFYHLDAPLMANFPATAADGDLAPYYQAAARYAAEPSWLN
jgi:hypothetical protein